MNLSRLIDDADAISRFLNRVGYQRIDAHAFEGYQGLAARLADALRAQGVFYLGKRPQTIVWGDC